MATSTLSKPAQETSLRFASFSDARPDSISVLSLKQSPAPVRRLIVLVPGFEMDEVEFARRVWELASPPHLAVTFLVLCDDAWEEPYLRRRLATLTALTRDDRITIETRFETGRNWLSRIRSILREGDVVLCQNGHTVGWRRQPISAILDKLDIPVWVLKGFEMTTTNLRRKPLKEFLFWIVSLAIIAGFFWLQVKLADSPNDWVHSVLMYVSIFVEIGLIWGCNTLFL